LFYDETADSFDFHPIMRSFLYGRLTTAEGTGDAVHTLAVEYFKALPEPEKVVTLEDLAPVIEHYHHLVKAGKYDEARDLFRDRLHDPCYYQLSAYHLIIELLKPLFPGGDCDNCLPRLETESAQAWTLAALGNTYALSGRPAKAVPLFLLQSKLYEKGGDKVAVAIGLGNAAQDQFLIGRFSASTAHLRKSIALCREIKDEFKEAVGHQELGRVLAFQGKIKGAEEELAQSTAYWEKTNDYQGLSVDSVYRSLSALLQARSTGVSRAGVVGVGKENRAAGHGREALEQARRALAFAEKDAETDCPTPRDFVRAYRLLGEALIQCGEAPMDSLEIPFYDEYFQGQIHAVTVKTGSVHAAAEGCLNEALRRCRKVNLVENEPDILLGLARLDRANRRPPDETRLEEVLEIALRAGYRRVLADLHLFCGRVLLEMNDAALTAGGAAPLLDLTASQHLQKAKAYARDVSEVSHLYQSAVSTPDFYKDIPEYDMLNRGMTGEERITNGYWPAYEMAEELEKD
jgi:tetratricopeptide (TPR) repeat protein